MSLPSFTSTPVSAVNEDALYTYNITATDPNGRSPDHQRPHQAGWLTFTDNGDGTATLTGTPTNAEVGEHSIELYVSDGELGDEQPFTIVVANTNDAPSFTSTPLTEAFEDTLYIYHVTTTDPDNGAILTIIAPTLPVWLSSPTTAMAQPPSPARRPRWMSASLMSHPAGQRRLGERRPDLHYRRGQHQRRPGLHQRAALPPWMKIQSTPTTSLPPTRTPATRSSSPRRPCRPG